MHSFSWLLLGGTGEGGRKRGEMGESLFTLKSLENESGTYIHTVLLKLQYN